MLFFISLHTLAKDTLKLEPNDVVADVGSLATFNCCVSCELSQTHTIRWFLGSGKKRLVDSDFEHRTGIHVEIQDVSVCASVSDHEIMNQQLHVNISSPEELNRTAVQCSALRKSPMHTDFYSHFSIIIVNGMLYNIIYSCYQVEHEG